MKITRELGFDHSNRKAIEGFVAFPVFAQCPRAGAFYHIEHLGAFAEFIETRFEKQERKPIMPEMSKGRAIELIKCQLDEIPKIKAIALAREFFSPNFATATAIFGIDKEFDRWYRSTRICISKIFGERSEHYEEFLSIEFLPASASVDQVQKREAFVAGFNRIAGILESMIKEVQDY